MAAKMGGAATVASVDNTGSTIFASAYGDGGICFYIRISDQSPLKTERGAGFSATCSAAEPASSITWSSNNEFPESSKVEMPSSSVEVGGAKPAGSQDSPEVPKK
jgi:hypothetical protein